MMEAGAMRTTCGGTSVGARRALTLAAATVIAVMVSASVRPALAASADELDREAGAALERLYRNQPSARVLGRSAKGILVFPSMVKAGFMFGGQIGEGVLWKGRRVAGFYNSVAASYGFQAGVQTFSYALFFMSDAALQQLDATHGFELGVGPSLVVVDQGVATSITSNTLTSDIYAYVFAQRGLMAGIGIQGSKITRISK
jgi:lipid-binding SYLF domain-containing protein